MSAEAFLAAVVLVACLVALGRMALGERRRRALDAQLQRHGQALGQRAKALWRQRRASGQARREADELLRRMREGKPTVEREGNVYRPRQFGGRGERPRGDGDGGTGPDTDPARDTPDGRHRRDH
jgi:hypothetical protein